MSHETIRVTEAEIEEAYEKVDPVLLEVIRKALVNIRSYHEKQRRDSWFDSQPEGTILGQKITALERVGVYVPGGKAVYPSSVLMNIVPAKGSRGRSDYYDDPSRKRRESKSVHAGGSQRGRSRSGLQSGRCAGDCRAGVWYREYSAGRQDCGSRKYLCGSGRKRQCMAM